MKKFYKEFLIVMIFAIVITSAFAISRSNSSSASNQYYKQKSSDKIAEPRGHEPWYIDGYGSDMGAHGKTDYYWLIPLVIVIGFGALLIPLLGTLMTTMITQGTINLTAGRKKRSTESYPIYNKRDSIPDYIVGLLTKVEDALEKFGNEIKSDVSPLKSRFEAQNF